MENQKSATAQSQSKTDQPAAGTEAPAKGATPAPAAAAAAAGTAPAAKAKTKEEIQEAAEAAAAKVVAANKAAFEKSNSVPVLKKTKENYVPEPGTEGEFHLVVEKRAFNATTGERTSTPKLQYFSPKAYENFKNNAIGLGYFVTVLHDPTGDYAPAGMQILKDAEKAAKAAAEKK